MRVLAAAQPVPGLIADLLAAMPQEHERALGNWQAETAQFPDVLIHALRGGHALAELLEGVRFDEARCRANIDALQGTIFSESLAGRSPPHSGKPEAQALVAHRVHRARAIFMHRASVRTGAALRADNRLAAVFGVPRRTQASDRDRAAGASAQQA